MLPATATAPVVEPEELLANVDGLLLIGGGDLDPALYGQFAHEKSYGFNPPRDAMELGLAAYALAEDIPMLAICRGCQVVNVACGGTLHQHMPEVPGFHVDAHGRPHNVVFAEHSVTVEPGTGWRLRSEGNDTSKHARRRTIRPSTRSAPASACPPGPTTGASRLSSRWEGIALLSPSSGTPR